MKTLASFSTIVLAAACLGLLAAPSTLRAQQGSASSEKAKKPATRTSAKPSTKTPAKPAGIAAASPEQVELSQRVLTGKIDCELGAHITVEQHAKHPGYVDVRHQKSEFIMKPVMSSTGTLRLEDVKGVGLLLQVASKSMLMNVKTGQRVVDGCEHPEQKALMERLTREGIVNPLETVLKPQ